MGLEMPMPAIPDTFGLPEYFITDIHTEVDGPNVRVVCGVRRGGHIHWLYSCVMRSDLLLQSCLRCREAAEEAFNMMQMMDRRGAAGRH